jgi:hypothetical protein
LEEEERARRSASSIYRYIAIELSNSKRAVESIFGSLFEEIEKSKSRKRVIGIGGAKG